MSEQDPRPSWICTTPQCKRPPYQDGECWLCPDCKKKLDDRIKELQDALTFAAAALDIAADWNVENVQVGPPAEWGLEAYGEDPVDGWCSTWELAQKLKEIARS